jgi:hypothetical protein
MPGNPLRKTMSVSVAGPAQVFCEVQASCDASAATYFQLDLGSPGGTVKTVSRVMASPWARNDVLRVAASLSLPGPATYQWTALFGTSLGGIPPSGRIENFEPKIVPVDPVPMGYIAHPGVSGASDGFMSISCSRECEIHGGFNATGALADGVEVTATLVIRREGARSIESYPATIRGPSNPPLTIDATPLWLMPNVLHTVTYVLSPMAPQSAFFCGVGFSG